MSTNTYSVTFTIYSIKSNLKQVTISCVGEAHDANMLANAVFFGIRKKYPQAMIHRGETIAEVANDT